MVFLKGILLDTLMQIFIMLWHLVAKISRFKFDDDHGASDLKLFVGGVWWFYVMVYNYGTALNEEPLS